MDTLWKLTQYGFEHSCIGYFNFKLTDGETLSEVQKRNITALQEVMQLYKGKTIVIGSHGTALSTIINYFTPQFGIEEFVRIGCLCE